MKRVTDDLAGAEVDLEHADAVAVRDHLLVERARIHFLQGNLCFPRGDLDGCLREHGIGLDLARRAGATELEAMALGGLGDAEYVRGRMISAHDRFQRMRRVVRTAWLWAHRSGEPPNDGFHPMVCRRYKSRARGRRYCDSSGVRVGHRRAEMVGHHAAFFCRHALMDFEAASRHAEAALKLAQQLGARRFETEALVSWQSYIG